MQPALPLQSVLNQLQGQAITGGAFVLLAGLVLVAIGLMVRCAAAMFRKDPVAFLFAVGIVAWHTCR